MGWPGHLPENPSERGPGTSLRRDSLLLGDRSMYRDACSQRNLYFQVSRLMTFADHHRTPYAYALWPFDPLPFLLA